MARLLPSDRYLDLNAITERINDLAPEAQQLLHTLNERATEMKVTIERVNDLLNAQNRANLAGTLAQTHQMIAENRPQVKATLEPSERIQRKTGAVTGRFEEDFRGSQQNPGSRGRHDRRKSGRRSTGGDRTAQITDHGNAI